MVSVNLMENTGLTFAEIDQFIVKSMWTFTEAKNKKMNLFQSSKLTPSPTAMAGKKACRLGEFG